MAAAKGSTYRRCSCRDENGKSLGKRCPKLMTNRRHGQWAFRVELPDDAQGNRRPRRRGGFDSNEKAQEQLDHVRDLLAIAEDDDVEMATRIGDLIAHAFSARQEFPDLERMRRLVRAGPVLDDPLMDTVFDDFLALKKRTVARNTYRSYESHIRLYLRPHLKHLRRSKLRVAHLDGMVEAIIEHNDDLIQQYRASGDPRQIETVKWQRPVGPSSLGSIRDTLRAILSPFVK